MVADKILRAHAVYARASFSLRAPTSQASSELGSLAAAGAFLSCGPSSRSSPSVSAGKLARMFPTADRKILRIVSSFPHESFPNGAVFGEVVPELSSPSSCAGVKRTRMASRRGAGRGSRSLSVERREMARASSAVVCACCLGETDVLV